MSSNNMSDSSPKFDAFANVFRVFHVAANVFCAFHVNCRCREQE